jgi:hypothetical protein
MTEEYFRIVVSSLRRTIKYHQSWLAKLKKSRKRLDALKFLEHRKSLEACQSALQTSLNKLDDLKQSELS